MRPLVAVGLVVAISVAGRSLVVVGQPMVDYATYLSGPAFEAARDVAVDAAGNFYVTGASTSPGFVTTPGAHDTTHNGSADVILMKFAPSGQLLYSTFLGGPNYDRAYAIELDSAGNIYLGGRAGPGFPTTPGVLQPSFGGDVAPNTLYGQQDGFLAKLTPSLQVAWATYFGGDDLGFVRDIDVDLSGVYLASAAMRPWPKLIGPNAWQPAIAGGNDGVIAKVAADGQSILWATYFGGTAREAGENSIRVDAQGNAYFLTATQSTNIPTTPGVVQPARGGGQDWHLSKWSPTGQLVWATYYGGPNAENVETHHLALSVDGRPIIAAPTTSPALFVSQGAFQGTYAGSSSGCSNYCGDGYIVRLSADGRSAEAGTYLGGSAGDGIEGVDADAGRVAVTGGTFSTNFPVTAGVPQPKTAGAIDLFVSVLSADLTTLQFSTYWGGKANDVGRGLAIGSGHLYVNGETISPNFPTTPGALSSVFGGGHESDGVIVRVAVPVWPPAPTHVHLSP